MAASEDLEVAGLELEHYRAGDERKIPDSVLVAIDIHKIPFS
jgi:hypothetical protein